MTDGWWNELDLVRAGIDEWRLFGTNQNGSPVEAWGRVAVGRDITIDQDGQTITIPIERFRLRVTGRGEIHPDNDGDVSHKNPGENLNE